MCVRNPHLGMSCDVRIHEVCFNLSHNVCAYVLILIRHIICTPQTICNTLLPDLPKQPTNQGKHVTRDYSGMIQLPIDNEGSGTKTKQPI